MPRHRAAPLTPRKITSSTFVIATNGFADGPGQALRDYLLDRQAGRVTVIQHPLVAEDPATHVVTTYASGRQTARSIRLPNRPPFTYLLDPLVPLLPPRTDAWFGFNNLGVARGLAQRGLRKAGFVYYWAVDFVPNRFGGGPATWLYEKADRLASTRADARIELSEAAANGRAAQVGLAEGTGAPVVIVPMGAWLARVPTVPVDAWARSRVVFLGHLVERQGVSGLLDAMPRLLSAYPEATLEIIGRGPEEEALRAQAATAGLGGAVSFRGFVEDHAAVEVLLAGASVAVAPYLQSEDNFTRFADPGKLKAYLAAGLPIVVTPVPPNVRELEASGAALVSDGQPEALADTIGRFLGDEKLWASAHASALEYAKQFEWAELLGSALLRLGWD